MHLTSTCSHKFGRLDKVGFSCTIVQMNVVIDTSAIIAVIANEQTKPTIVTQTIGATLLAPASLPWEIGNAISAMFKRTLLSLNQSQTFINEYNKIPIRLVEINMLEAVKIAYDHKIYAYDAYMLQCAKEKRSSLLTLDKGLAAVAKLLNINLVEV